MLWLLILSAFVTGAHAERLHTIDARQSFERLKALVGDWSTANGHARFSYKLIANGSALQETIAPGTDHEMITIYNLDGDDLVLTHYCIFGNQPRMKLRREGNPGKLVFEYSGGTNFNPFIHAHMHDHSFTFRDNDHMRSEWSTYKMGIKVDTKTFDVARVR